MNFELAGNGYDSVSLVLTCFENSYAVDGDVQQYFVEQELSAYAPDPDMFAALGDKIPPLQTTDAAVMGTEKVTQFSQISDLDESKKMLLTTPVIDAVSNTSIISRPVSGSIPKSQATKKVQRSTNTTVMQNENTNVADESETYIMEKVQEIQDNNSGSIGWLYLPDTNINYPVMYSGDNDFYLHRAFDGSYLYAGSIFAELDKLLMMSTCSTAGKNLRVVVTGKLIQIE